MAKYTRQEAQEAIMEKLLEVRQILHDYDPEAEGITMDITLDGIGNGQDSISVESDSCNPKAEFCLWTSVLPIKEEVCAVDSTDIRIVELWIDKLDGKALLHQLFDPLERRKAAELARNAILNGWVVHCS